MRCANCGKGVFSAVKVCPYCRAPVVADTRAEFERASTPPGTAPVSRVRIKFARWHLLVASAVVIAGIASFFVYWATSGLVEPIVRQLDAFKRDDLQGAYAEMSVGFHREISFEKFSEFVKNNPALSHNLSYRFTSRSSSSSLEAGGAGVGDVKGGITDEQGVVVPVRYGLVKESGVWKIKGIHLGRKIAAQPG